MSSDTRLPLQIPAWPAPKNIQACYTTRTPGKSLGEYAEFNLALHVNDHALHVQENRQNLTQCASLPTTPKWLNQIHSATAVLADTVSFEFPPDADASFTRSSNEVCAVMTADCLPILVTNKAGTEVAAIHAGWQGLAKGVIESTLSKLSSPPNSLLIWIGPSIHQANYEVGEDFYAAFAKQHSSHEMSLAFSKQPHQKWRANVPLLAVQRLKRLGVSEKNIYLSQECTYAHPEKYFSYRRDGVTGRMASLIWIDS